MMPANVKLSKNELTLVCDEQFILTKNNIINKVYEFFGILSNEFAEELKNAAIASQTEIFYNAPKIYKGEQYKSLPYVMLDHPRFFNKEDAFAVRCFFWWGNFFSITLHLSGKYKIRYAPAVIKALRNNEWYYCINENQWQHHFQDNYELVSKDFSLVEKSVEQKSFFKIAKKIPLSQWDDAYDFYKNNFKQLLQMLA